MLKNIHLADLNFLEKQVEPLFRATLSGGLANIFCACLIYVFLYNSPQQSDALILSLAIILLSVVRILLSNRYLDNMGSNINVYLHTHVIFTLFIGVLWGAFVYMQLSYNDESLRNLVILVNFGLIAASIATLSAWMPAYLAYMIPQSLAIFYVFANMNSEYNVQIAGSFVIYAALMVVNSFRFNHRLISELQLIDDLNREIGVREEVQFELEHSKQNLEKKVVERTKELTNANTHLESVILKKEEAEKSLQYLAYHDELTGLPNKNLLIDRIDQSIRTSSREDQSMAILFLDLDRFKNINDSLGHNIGDLLIQEVSTRLHKILRSRDTVSRNGGDEFVVVLERLESTDEAVHVAKKIISYLTETFDIQSHKIHIGASIGISIYPNDGDNSAVLLRNADTAMYKAKKSGGNQLQFYDESMSNKLRNRLVLENELHSALHNNEFHVVYQPQVDCLTGKTTGFESLLRWSNKKCGEISPVQFVPLLEETGLIYSVGEWVIKEVIEFIRIRPASDLIYAINLSVLQFNNYKFIEFVKNEISKAGINPSQIEFEITESLLINDFDKTKSFLNELHALGCAIALDDFGTGYTSMNYLARLPIDVIKIDKSLVRNINSSGNLKSIVTAIVTMSKSLGMKNIFEGIETKEELSVIQSLNGRVIQGFIYSKPLLAKDVDGWLSSGQEVNQARVL